MIAAEISDFEGLVLSTARMFARQVQREEEDLAQELRVRVWRAIEQFDAGRSTWINRGYEQALRGYVYRAVSNKIRDYKRDAGREKAKDRQGQSVNADHIEDFQGNTHHVGTAQDWFDALYNFVTEEQVYGSVLAVPFQSPVALTPREHAVAAMLALGYDRDECAIELGCSRATVNDTVSALRRKLADYL